MEKGANTSEFRSLWVVTVLIALLGGGVVERYPDFPMVASVVTSASLLSMSILWGCYTLSRAKVKEAKNGSSS